MKAIEIIKFIQLFELSEVIELSCDIDTITTEVTSDNILTGSNRSKYFYGKAFHRFDKT